MQAFDVNPEQRPPEGQLETKVGEKMLQEVMGTDFKDWKNILERSDAKNTTMFNKNWQSDSGGKLVQLDMMTGKLLTRNERGVKVEYEAHSDNQRMQSKNSLALSSIFMVSPLMMLGMGTTFAMMDQVQDNFQDKEVKNLKNKLKGDNRPGTQPNQNGDAVNTAKGISKEMILKSFLVANDKNPHNPQESNPDFEQIRQEKMKNEFDKWIKDAESSSKKRKKKIESTGKLERKRQNLRQSTSFDTKMTVGKLMKKKVQIEDLIESGHENGTSLAEASKLQSQLEALDRAISILTVLG